MVAICSMRCVKPTRSQRSRAVRSTVDQQSQIAPNCRHSSRPEAVGADPNHWRSEVEPRRPYPNRTVESQMPNSNGTLKRQLASLATPEGGFAIVALDQRESLREMFPPNAGGDLVDDAALRAFKTSAAEILTPYASGVLLDRPYAVTEAKPPMIIAKGCGLILAADVLDSVRGLGVQSSSLDTQVNVDFIRATGAAAIKLLVIWRRGIDRDRGELVDRFLAVSYTHLRAHETDSYLVCRLLL